MAFWAEMARIFKEKIAVNRFYSAITAILIGIIGSALWERVFSKLFDYISDKIVYLLSFLSTTIVDAIYIEISKSYFSGDVAELQSEIFVYTLYLSAVIFIYKRGGYSKIAMGSLVVFLSLVLFRQSHIKGIVVEFRRGVTIIAPYIPKEQYDQFFARFATMKGKGDFDRIKDDIKIVAGKNNVSNEIR